MPWKLEEQSQLPRSTRQIPVFIHIDEHSLTVTKGLQDYDIARLKETGEVPGQKNLKSFGYTSQIWDA